MAALEIEFMFPNASVTRECTYKNDKGDEILVEVFHKYYGGILVIENQDDFNLETVLLNKNQEWKNYKFLPPEENFPDMEITLDPENDEYEDILIEQDIGLVEEKLSEDGYKMISDEWIYEEGKLQLVE